MLQADTKSLEQQVNINYINLIRLRELNYYSSFYLTFGGYHYRYHYHYHYHYHCHYHYHYHHHHHHHYHYLYHYHYHYHHHHHHHHHHKGQAAIIGGFSFAAITQINFSDFCNPLSEGQVFNPFNGTAAPTPSPTEEYVTVLTSNVQSCQGPYLVFFISIQDFFWILQAITMALAFRVMVHSILLVTVGPMKAFSGKKGSILSVIQEFEANKQNLFKTFGFMISGFVGSIFSYIFIGLRTLPAEIQSITAISFIVFMILLYYSAYSSFKVFAIVADNKSIFMFTWEILKSLVDCKSFADSRSKTLFNSNINDQLKKLKFSEKNEDGITLKATGYMRKKLDIKSKNQFSHFKLLLESRLWKDRFFIVVENQHGSLDLYYYTHEGAFAREPENPIKERPIQLNDYELEKKINLCKDQKIVFELKPKVGKNITRKWILEVGQSEMLWQVISSTYEFQTTDMQYSQKQNSMSSINSETLMNPLLSHRVSLPK